MVYADGVGAGMGWCGSEGGVAFGCGDCYVECCVRLGSDRHGSVVGLVGPCAGDSLAVFDPQARRLAANSWHVVDADGEAVAAGVSLPVGRGLAPVQRA